MPLKSSGLSGNRRLQQVADGGTPIRPAPPKDDIQAVQQIQRALVALLGIRMPLSFPDGPDGDPDGDYGDETYKAVIKFQKVVFPNEPKQWDGRVGRLTLAELDKRLTLTGGFTPGPAPKPPTTFPIGLSLGIVLANSTPPHDMTKSDLDSTLAKLPTLSTRRKAALLFPLPIHPSSGPSSPLPIPLKSHSTRSLELYFQQEALVASLGSAGGRRLIADFFANRKAKGEIVYAHGSDVSVLVRDDAKFMAEAAKFEADFVKRMRLVLDASSGQIDGTTLLAELAARGGPMQAPALPFFGLGSKLGILGSFQESRVRLMSLDVTSPKKFTAELQYELFDHFGCDDADLEGLPSHGTPGQIAMWLLARDPAHAPGHKPFVVHVDVSRTVKDKRP